MLKKFNKDNKSLIKIIIIGILAMVMIMTFAYVFGYMAGLRHQEKYFAFDSQKYLNGYQLSVPEEISKIANENGDQVTHIIGIRKENTKIIYLEIIRTGSNNKDDEEDYEEDIHSEIRPTNFIYK